VFGRRAAQGYIFPVAMSAVVTDGALTSALLKKNGHAARARLVQLESRYLPLANCGGDKRVVFVSRRKSFLMSIAFHELHHATSLD
jgi:hypothetical protein